MKILNKSFGPTINGICIVVYTKEYERLVFYCAAVAHTKDGKARFYIRDEKYKTAYRIVLRTSDFLLLHAMIWHGGSFKVESGYLTELNEQDWKLMVDFASGAIG